MKKFLMVIIVSVFLISACSNENKTISASNTYVSKADDEKQKVSGTIYADDEIQQVTADLNASKYMINAYIINENITIGTYVPIVEQSYGNTTCRVDLVLHNYN